MNTPRFWFVCVAVGGLLLLALQGCDLRSAITVEVPPAVGSVAGYEGTIKLAQADQVVSAWRGYVERNTQALEAAISDAEERYTALRSLTELGLQAASTAAAPLPGGALILSGLSLLGGLFIPKPGSQEQLRREKEDSYNAGLDRGREMAP